MSEQDKLIEQAQKRMEKAFKEHERNVNRIAMNWAIIAASVSILLNFFLFNH